MAKYPEDQLNQYGEQVAKAHFAATTMQGVFVGISWFMCIYGLFIFLEAPQEARKGRSLYLAVSFAICILLSAVCALDLWSTFEHTFSSLPTGLDFLRQYSRLPHLLVSSHITIAFTDFYILLGDSLMIYRVFLLWRDRLWVVIPPATLVLAHLAIAILAQVELDNDKNAINISLARIPINLATNILVTGLILTRLIETRRKMAASLPPGSKPQRMYSDVTAIIVESAAPLVVFGPACAISQIAANYVNHRTLRSRGGWEIARSLFQLLYYSFGAISPQMIIFRVTTGRSWKGVKDATEGVAAFSQPLQFHHTTVDRSRYSISESVDTPSAPSSSGAMEEKRPENV